MKTWICFIVVISSFMKIWIKEILLFTFGFITNERFRDNSEFIVWGIESYANDLAKNIKIPCEVSATYLAHLHKEVYGER